MAVPGSGQLLLSGIYAEVNVNDYSVSGKLPSDVSLASVSDGTNEEINKCNMPHNRPDESAPHSMSEFYSYDGDRALPGFLAEDWEDGDIGDGTRRSIGQNVSDNGIGHELAESGDLDSSELDDSFTDDGPDYTVSTRPAWTHSPSSPSLDTDNDVRFTNSNSPQGMWLKTTYTAKSWSGDLTSEQICYAYRWRFFMNSTNNKDGIIDVRMNTTNHPNPGISTNTYQIQIKDNADPSPGAIRLASRATTSVTTIATSPSTAYTVGTTMDFVFSVHEAQTWGNPRTLKVAVGPTTTSTPDIINSYNKISAVSTTYTTNYGWNFRCPKAMSTPTSTHYHKYNFLYATVLRYA